MKDWLDREQLWCPTCRHRWILTSTKEITDMQHHIWIKAVMEHHARIIKINENKNQHE